MLNRGLLLWLLVAIISLQSVLAQNPQAETEYRMAPGDRISISVYGESTLSFSNLPIPTSGMINFPFLGQLRAENKSELELARDITLGLQDGYLLQPQVAVAVTSYRPVFVSGGVGSPGKISYSIGMDVERLIAIAGGFTEWANKKELFVLRRGEGNHRVIMVNYLDIISGRDFKGNIILQADDTIVVP